MITKYSQKDKWLIYKYVPIKILHGEWKLSELLQSADIDDDK